MAVTVCADPCSFDINDEGQLQIKTSGCLTVDPCDPVTGAGGGVRVNVGPYPYPLECPPGGVYCSGGTLVTAPASWSGAADIFRNNTGSVDRPVPNTPTAIPELSHTAVLANDTCHVMSAFLITTLQVTFEGGAGAVGRAHIEWNGDADMIQHVRFSGANSRLGTQCTRMQAFMLSPHSALAIPIRALIDDNDTSMRYAYAQMNTRSLSIAVG